MPCTNLTQTKCDHYSSFRPLHNGSDAVFIVHSVLISKSVAVVLVELWMRSTFPEEQPTESILDGSMTRQS